MDVHKIGENTMIAVSNNKNYLIIKQLGEERSVQLLGKIQAIDITGDYIPEFEEREVEE